MCDHEARSARFIGHRWGRGRGDATENLLQTSIINRLGSVSVRWICGTERIFNFYSSVRVVSGGGQCCVGEGRRSREKKKKKEKRNPQTNKQNRQQVTTALAQHLHRKLTGAIFFVLKTRGSPESDYGRLRANSRYSSRALRETRRHARRDASR